MSNFREDFSGVIKELCKLCYEKKLHHPLVLTNNEKKCENSNCNNSLPYYVNAKNYQEFVRDFQNSSKPPTSKNVMKCSFIETLRANELQMHISKCTYSHNDFEYFVWNYMSSNRIYKISDLYKKYIEPYIYIPVIEANHTPRTPQPTQIQFDHTVNYVPQSVGENERMQQDEKKKKYLCFFCLKEITGEKDITRHIEGQDHKAFYKADKKRRWYFKMPTSDTVSNCEHSKDCSCPMAHSDDEFLEMITRLKYRKFMSQFEQFENNIPAKVILPWPSWLKMKMPKFPINIKCYNNPVQLFANLSIGKFKCQSLSIYLRDDESRPFFKLTKANGSQTLNYKNQLLTMSLNDNVQKSEIEFGIEFHPCYSSTYCQKIEFHLINDGKELVYCKRIRIDVGTEEHLTRFKEFWYKYESIISRKTEYKSYLPFNFNERKRRSILTEDLLNNVTRIIPNLNWVKSTVKSYNYVGWMTDMIILEELAQRLILSKLTYDGKMSIQNSISTDKDVFYAQDGKLYGKIKFESHHDVEAREIIMNNVSNCYLVFQDTSNQYLFESELVDAYRYKIESRMIDGVEFCLSKLMVETVKIKSGDNIDNVRIHFNFDRLVFDRRIQSLFNIPFYDKLSYNPLPCPFFTRLPYGDNQKDIVFNPYKNLNEEQRRLPILVLRRLKDDEIPLPFILNGAFGTGKSEVFAETVMTILKIDCGSRILICTRSYSAAELYLDLFKDRVKELIPKIKVLKSDHKKLDQPFQTNTTTIYNADFNEDVFTRNLVFITTLDNSVDCLTPHLEVMKEKLYFKYIFVDEAAQVLEADAVMVYQFGRHHTKFIFAGDIFQTRPDIFNEELKKFSVPIICRLYNEYDSLPNYTICLKQVYRTHRKIVEFLSEAIYYKIPLVSLLTPEYPHLNPMKFANCSSEWLHEEYDVQFCSYKNESESSKICSEIKELKSLARQIEDKNILVCTPFFAQVKLLRAKLKKMKLGSIVVERPQNIQGREFDAVFISTVLTRFPKAYNPILHQTFHSNKSLINLVISRAKHFVEVVGDKYSLTSMGSPTSKQWQLFVDMCSVD